MSNEVPSWLNRVLQHPCFRSLSHDLEAEDGGDYFWIVAGEPDPDATPASRLEFIGETLYEACEKFREHYGLG